MTKHNVIWAALLLAATLGILGHPCFQVTPIVSYFGAMVGAAYCSYKTNNRRQCIVASAMLLALAFSGFAWSLLSLIGLGAVGVVFALLISDVAGNFDSPDRY